MTSADERIEVSYGMTYHHTMRKAKVALSLDAGVVRRIDELVKQRTFVNRSQAVEEALREKLARLDRTRLNRELAKLDVEHEKSLAEEGLDGDARSWPAW